MTHPRTAGEAEGRHAHVSHSGNWASDRYSPGVHGAPACQSNWRRPLLQVVLPPWRPALSNPIFFVCWTLPALTTRRTRCKCPPPPLLFQRDTTDACLWGAVSFGQAQAARQACLIARVPARMHGKHACPAGPSHDRLPHELTLTPRSVFSVCNSLISYDAAQKSGSLPTQGLISIECRACADAVEQLGEGKPASHSTFTVRKL